jgi:squalene cyclase
MKSNAVMHWLLEDSQPSIKYLVLTQLLGRTESDPDVRSARELLTHRGWAAEILSKQYPDGWWVSGKSLSRPKYTATYWMLLILSDLGVTKEEPRIGQACELWLDKFAKKDGGFGYDRARISELCITASTAKSLIRFGYSDHPRVKTALQWVIKDQKENGGWRCGWRGGIIDGWEPMSLFANYPKAKWTRSIKHAVERGAEFYLSREMHREGKRYEPWYRFHYPVHYYYDLLVGLDFMTTLGFGDDRRLKFAISVLKEKRRPDGRWNLDAVHPDLEGRIAELYARKPPTPFSLEPVGQPSKMITFLALKVLKKSGDRTIAYSS